MEDDPVTNDEPIYTLEKLKEKLEIPNEFLPLVLAHPQLLPGETSDDFFRLFDIMVGVIAPLEDIEWLATIELTWLQWDINRYRRWKNKIIANNRASALATALSKTHPGCYLPGAMATIAPESRMQAMEINTKPGAHSDLLARLESHGYDLDINAGAFVHSIALVAAIDNLLSSARRQVAMILRQVELQKEFIRRARSAMKQLEQHRQQAQQEPTEA